MTIDELKQRAEKAKYVYWSFSGGRDSTDALFATYDLYKDKQRKILYVDNGSELPDLILHIKRVVKQLGAELTIIKNTRNFYDYYTQKGKFPDSIHRDCIEILVNKPMDDYMRAETNGEDYVLIRGGNSKQKTTRSGTKIYQSVKAKPHMIIYNPLYEIDRSALPENIPYWKGYDLGFVRTACWCCPFQKPQQYRALQQNYPLLHDELQRMFEELQFRVHPGDGYLKYISEYWVNEVGATVNFYKKSTDETTPRGEA